MDINYELYKVFYYVADTLSFSEASKQLFISQSAVSQSIKALEKKLDQKYTIDQILPTLQEMDFMKYEGKGYQPVYTRTELTDALHDAFGFCTSKQIVPIAKMRNICSQTKK